MAICIDPITRKNTTARKQGSAANPIAKGNLTVPCGQCAPCLARKQQEWAFRLHWEDKDATTSYFYTMTYHDLFLVTDTRSQYPTLVKEHIKDYVLDLKQANLQEVMKDLDCTWRQAQKYEKENPFKYFIVGEYGEKFGRPHYHAYFKNLHPRLAKDPVKHWEKGDVDVGTVTPASIAYITKYMRKPQKHFSKDMQRIHEFSLKSKGLGSQYIKANAKYHKNNRTNMTKFQGYDTVLPRYMKDKIFTDYERRIANDKMQLALDSEFWNQVQRISKSKESTDAWLEHDQRKMDEATTMHLKTITEFKKRKL